jgi:hypothetical protein
MSAFRGKADAFSCSPTCPLMTQSGLADLYKQAWGFWERSGSRAIALLFDLKKLAARSLDADEAAALLELIDARL